MSFVEEVPITKVAVSHVIGKGGETIKNLKSSTNTSIEIIDGTTVKITGENEADVKKCRELVEGIIAEQANPDYEGPEGKRLRAEADEIGKKRDSLKAEAQQKFENGDKDAGHKMMADVSKLTAEMHEKNKEAAKAIVKNRNEGKGESYLDLHGLRTEEALEVTRERIAELEQKPVGTTTELELIPGAGHHSAPGKVALKPACADLLINMKLKYTDHSAGSFMVTVPGKGADNKKEAEPTAPATATTSEPHGDDNKKLSETAAAEPAPAAAVETVEPLPPVAAQPPKEKKSNEGCGCAIM